MTKRLTEMERKMAEDARTKKTDEEVSSAPVDFTVEGSTVVDPPEEGLEEDLSNVGENTEKQSIVRNDQLSPSDLERFAGLTKDKVPEKEEKNEEDQNPPRLEVEEETPNSYAGEHDVEFCSRCGFNLASDAPEPSKADKQEFIKSILGERRFQKSFEYFNGNVIVCLRGTTIEDENTIAKILKEETDSGKLVTMGDYEERHFNLRLSYTLERVIVKGTHKEYDEIINDNTVKEQIKEHEEKRNKLPAVISGILSYAVEDFNQLYTMLTSRAEDPDFWKGLTGSKN